VATEPPSKLQEAGHAWLAHLRAEGRSVKTLYDRERNLFAIVFPHLAELGVSQPAQITSRMSARSAVVLAYLRNCLLRGHRSCTSTLSIPRRSCALKLASVVKRRLQKAE
jgi:hypothetical protein